MNKKQPKVRAVELDSNPKGKLKALTGAEHDDWNNWLAQITSLALPVNQNDEAGASKAAVAVFSGMIDMKPCDPIEGIIISQLMAANQASLSMYRRAWAQPSEYFEAQTKYLALADKAARTVAMLTERLDHHRGRGQQQIVVKHVTVNAEQAVVADQVVKANPPSVAPDKLLPAGSDKPMPLEVEAAKEPVGGGTKQK